MSEVAVIGAGAWGCALAGQAARAGATVTLWARTAPRAAVAEGVRLVRALPAAPVMLLAVPVQHLRTVAAELRPALWVACCKGVETGTHLLPLEILGPGARAVLSGPNFAHEVAACLPTAAVLASTDATVRTAVADLLGTAAFRLYGSADTTGVQVAGAAKNVIAIAAGAVIGAGLGENARAALVTRGLAEIGRLASALGGRAETVAGLSGLGDLLLTCTGPASRNFSLGVALGRGETLPSVLAGRQAVTEGVATAPALLARATAAGVEMPICAAVAAVLAGRLDVPAAVAGLLARDRRDE